MSYAYRALSFTTFVSEYKESMPETTLFELTLPWLQATKDFMLAKNSQVIVHCLYQGVEGGRGEASALSIAWPLVHTFDHNSINDNIKTNDKNSSQVIISALTSFYSSVTAPIFFTSVTKGMLHKLLFYIDKSSQWTSMQLGAFEEGMVAQAIGEYFTYQRIFSQTDNAYQVGISDYAQYYKQRPSQLRNTLKRREKKLAKVHSYRIDIVSDIDDFPSAFIAYKAIYQQSWKGNEFSFKFIEQVCLAALVENKLRLGLLFVDNEPAAAQLWFLQSATPSGHNDEVKGNNRQRQTTASIFKLAYTPKYQQYSVGSLLSLALSEHVISQDNVASIEFGMGCEPYKKDWLTENRTRNVYQVFNPRGIYGKLVILRKLVLSRFVNRLLGK